MYNAVGIDVSKGKSTVTVLQTRKMGDCMVQSMGTC